MSSAVTEKDQPPTTIDNDLQARVEARDVGEPGKQGGSGKEEAELIASASEDHAQEDDEDSHFDEDADWSDDEEQTLFDIVERYNFVWSEGWAAEPKAYEMGDSMIIYGSADQNQGDKPFRCTANFAWCNFVAQLTCIYRPDTQTFTNFKTKRKTMDGGMQDIYDVRVRMWEESWSKGRDGWVREEKEVKDDRGHLFLHVQMESGNYLGAWKDEAYVYGKKVVEDGGEDNVTLTKGEKERLRLPSKDYMDV